MASFTSRTLGAGTALVAVAAFSFLLGCNGARTAPAPAPKAAATGTPRTAAGLIPIAGPDSAALQPVSFAVKPAEESTAADLPTNLVLFRTGASTGTKEGTVEAVIVKGKVVRVGAHDTPLPPEGGAVLAATGQAGAWLRQHLLPGAEVELSSDRVTVAASLTNRLLMLDEESRLAQIELDAALQAKAIDAPQAALARAQVDRAKSERPLALAQRASGNTDRAMKLVATAMVRCQLARAMAVPSPAVEERAVWLRLTEPQASSIDRRLATLAEAGINTIFVEVYYDGRTLQPSRNLLAPQHQAFRGTDPLELLLNAARERGMKVHAWIHVLHLGKVGESPVMEKQPGWLAIGRDGEIPSKAERGAVFLSPASAEARAHLLGIIRDVVMLYGIDGVMLDDLRYPAADGWERSYDFSAAARQAFHAHSQRDPMELDPEKDAAAWAEWVQFREDQVTELLQAIRTELRRLKPEVRLGVRVPPDLEVARRWQAQHWALWAEAGLVDTLAPQILRQMPEEVEAALAGFRAQLPQGFPCMAGLSPFLRPSPPQLARQIEAAQRAGAQGIALLGAVDLDAAHLQALRYGSFRNRPPSALGTGPASATSR